MTVESFLSALKKSELLTPEQFGQAEEAARYLGDAEDLARVLARAELITLWQAGQLLAGRTSFLLGKYKLIKLLGRGGMGSVFLARHIAMNRQVALKIVSKQVGHDPASMERFFSEARAAALLDHPNIVRAYDVDSEGDRFFIVMEYVEGRDLQAMVEDDGPLDFDRAADYIRQAAEGLAHAHSRNMIHCDIKPSNLIVNSQGVVKILDLGVARLEGGKTADLTSSGGKGQVLGSVDFLAPEQAIGGPSFDKRADIYSLGCTLYYLLTGRPPFPEGTLAERILKHQGQAPRSMVSLRSGTPPELVSICRTMMAKAPADRYQTAEEVSWVLQDWRSAETLPRAQPLDEEAAPTAPVTATPLPGIPDEAAWKPAMAPLPRVQPPPRKKDGARMWPILVGGGAAGVLVALLLVLMLRAMQEPKAVRPRPTSPPRSALAPPVKPSQKQPIVPAPQPQSTPSPEAVQRPVEAAPVAKPERPPDTAPTAPITPEPEKPQVTPATPPPEAIKPQQPEPQEKTPAPAAKAVAKTEFPAEVTLPPVPSSPESPVSPLTLGALAPDAQASLSLELVGGAGAVRGEQDLVLRRVDSPDKPHQWDVLVESSPPASGSTPLAKFWLEGDAIKTTWLPDATVYTAGCLRNCLLVVREGENAHEIRLRNVEAVNPIAVKLSDGKATGTIPLNEIPDPSSLRLQVLGLEGPLPDQVIPADQAISFGEATDINATGEILPRILFRVVFLLRSEPAVVVSVRFDATGKGSHLFGKPDCGTLSRKQRVFQQNKQDDAQSRHTAALLAVCNNAGSAGKIYFRLFREVDGHQIELAATPPLPPAKEPAAK